jgi:chaperonin GroES
MMTNMEIKPVGDRVLILPDPVGEVSKSGIINPFAKKSATHQGLVVSVGGLVQNYKPGDRVIYETKSAVDSEIEGKQHSFVRESDILLSDNDG